MCVLKNFGKSLLIALILVGCGGSGGDTSTADDVDPVTVEVDDNSVADQSSVEVQIDPPVQSPDVQDEVEQSDNPGTDQSTDTEPAGDTLADTSDDSAAQDSDSVSAIDEPASVLLVPNGQLDPTGAPLLVPLPVPELVDIPAGCFDMGSPLDEPQRDSTEGPQFNVCFNDFRLGSHEITFTEYDAFALATGRALPDSDITGRDDRPVINVSWDDANDYTSWLSVQTGRNFRLPTEAEWEYAARAGSQTPFHTGQTITSDQANFTDTVPYNGSVVAGAVQQTLPVGSFSPNAFGLYDMHGNVVEWTCSRLAGDYRSPDVPQRCDSSSDTRRVVRGGSWITIAKDVRSAKRSSVFKVFGNRARGFRVQEQ